MGPILPQNTERRALSIPITLPIPEINHRVGSSSLYGISSEAGKGRKISFGTPRSHPKVPLASSVAPDPAGFLASVNTAQHVLEMFRRNLPDGSARRLLEGLANRLTKIASEARKLNQK